MRRMLTALLAVSALGFFAASAQAEEPRWTRSNVDLTNGTQMPFISWTGKTNVSLVTSQGEVNCRTVIGGTDENAAGIGGVGRVEETAMYACKAPQCEAASLEQLGLEGKMIVTGSKYPWLIQVGRGGLGEPLVGIHVEQLTLICETAATEVQLFAWHFSGLVFPTPQNGSSASKPSSLKWNGASSGELLGDIVNGTMMGSVKFEGSNEQELIGLKG